MTDSKEEKNKIISSDAKEGSPEQGEQDDNKSERRRHQRFELETEVTVHSGSGFFPGQSLDISESGMTAILPVELKIGETVELKIKLPITVATTRAVVRSRNVFRHGFGFLQPMHDVVWHETADDSCPSCGGTGLIVRIADRGHGVAFMRTRCSDCDGTGHDGRGG
ncbi:MAG TPA: PilZ domain-containing protein [Candidatus Sulfotelmatobacter sp.]|nr:PilZ domain-containing protein [Candidatus Sulfotelmatobacter sp.]